MYRRRSCPDVLSKKIFLGSQNLSSTDNGTSTGEVSALQLKNLKVSYSIVGHSERRALGETDEMVAKKIKLALKYGITPILCIGEKERDRHGTYLHLLEEQIRKSISGIGRGSISKIVIAYEPVWAIGKSTTDAMNSHNLHEMTIFIRKVLSSVCGRDLAHKVQIIYGGSVEKGNAIDLIKNGNVTGFLVGHASLDAKHFGEIMKEVDVTK